MKKGIALAMALLLTTLLLTACRNDHGLDAKNPVTLTLAHGLSGQMAETISRMADEFNKTTGAEKGIRINVAASPNSAALYKDLTTAGEGDAKQLPDIAIAGLTAAGILQKKGQLADLGGQFSKKELSAYIPEFLEEGRLGTKELYFLPVAKSVEVLFLNKTVFDRFASDTGAKYEDLSTFEGLANTAKLYFEWTDAQTPYIKNDGKTFFHADSMFLTTMIGASGQGSEFLRQGTPDYSSNPVKRIWSSLFEPVVRGYYDISESSASDLAKEGKIICSTEPSANAMTAASVLTYPDKTTEPVELAVLPYPVFEGGKKATLQSGSGMIVTKSDETREYAAGIFLKWFLSAEHNLKFAVSGGYLPVIESAYGKAMTETMNNLQNGNVKSMLKTVVDMKKNYRIYVAPFLDNMEALKKDYDTRFREAALKSRKTYLELTNQAKADEAYANASKGVFETFSKPPEEKK